MANREFDLQGVNHLALVCKDMARTVDFYSNVLGMPLIRTIELPGGMGQHSGHRVVTARSSIASAGQRDTRPCASSSCGPAKPSSTPAVPSISGSGKCGSWTRNPDRWGRMHRCAWEVVAQRRRNTAADPLATG